LVPVSIWLLSLCSGEQSWLAWASLRSSLNLRLFVRFLVSSRLVSSPAVSTCSAHGTLDVSIVTVTQSSITDQYPDEVGKRYSVFYLLGCVASAFSGILAYGVRLTPLSLSRSCLHSTAYAAQRS
jgi:hypothetical protein